MAGNPDVQRQGEAALHRLFRIAQGHSGQCRVVAAFLLGCYNGTRFPFDLTDFRRLDEDIHRDCLAVLAMDHQPAKEVHAYLPNGGEAFETLAEDWKIPDREAQNPPG